MIKQITTKIKTYFPAPEVEAHCDGPCGVYDPASARIAAEAVLSMTKKILALEPPAAGDKAAAIVQDLLIMARRGVTTKARLNLNALIEEYLDSPEHRALSLRFPKVGIETELSPDVMEIRGSPVQLTKAIMNLVSNAFEAGQMVGRVKIRSENRYVDHPIKGYDTVATGHYVALLVIDQGSGISEQDLPHIFEPFYTRKAMGRSGIFAAVTERDIERATAHLTSFFDLCGCAE